MATLTETAVGAKKVFLFGLVAVVAFLLLQVGLFFFNTYLKVVKPAPTPPPTVAFGKLTKIAWPQKLNPEITLRLETTTGGTPDLGDRAEVYLMPTFRSNFLALDQAKLTAKKMSFTDQPKEITDRRYRWETEEFLPSILEMDIINGSFSLKRNWQTDPTILSEKQLPGKEQTIIEVKNFLRQVGLLSSELENARIEISYLTFSSGQYQKAVSLSEADFVQADVFRPDINNHAVFPPNPQKGIISIIFSGSRETAKQIIQVDYNYFPVNFDQSATYPIKSASQAWRELQTKQGFIASVGSSSEVVAIRRIYLAYYDSETPNGFLMPIIVFEGDSGFYGYVPAITNEWLTDSPNGDSQTSNQ
ncbi:MAG: hypothetical protein NTZ93_03305 [Candidatus Beckwithbacteria bacterium]|nr:hypothetical protein [Candidatus Beckwithbacteria bacterium]